MAHFAVPKPRRGRPPGPRPPENFPDLIDAVLLRKHRLPRDGKIVRLTLLEVIYEYLAIEVARGNKRALRLMRSIQKDLESNPKLKRQIIYMDYEMLRVL